MVIDFIIIVGLIFLVCVIIFFISWFIQPTEIKTPTLYEHCDLINTCGGNLQCDNRHRCKQIAGGPCSSNHDCHHDLLCINWICTSKDFEPTEPPIPDLELTVKTDKPKTTKQVRWTSDP